MENEDFRQNMTQYNTMSYQKKDFDVKKVFSKFHGFLLHNTDSNLMAGNNKTKWEIPETIPLVKDKKDCAVEFLKFEFQE